jgi:phage tail-like protein
MYDSSVPQRLLASGYMPQIIPSRKSLGITEYEAITLELGVTHDLEFEKWANKIWNYGAGLSSEVLLKDLRKDITIELYNEAGQVVMAYNVYRCWYQSIKYYQFWIQMQIV